MQAACVYRALRCMCGISALAYRRVHRNNLGDGFGACLFLIVDGCPSDA